MRRLGTPTLLSVLAVTAVLSGACHVQSTENGAQAQSDPGTVGQSEASDDAATPPLLTAAPTPTLPPRTTEPSAQQLPGDEESAQSGKPAQSDDAELPGDPKAPDAGIGDGPAAQQEPGSNLVIAQVTDLDELPSGLEDHFRHSYPDRKFILHPEAAWGDLNSDGDDDAALHVQAQSAEGPQPHLLVPVIDTGGAFTLRSPVELGRHIIIDTIDIRDGAIEVSLFDRAPGEPLTTITRRTTLNVAMEGAGAGAADAAEPVVTVTSVEPISTVPSLQIIRPPTPTSFVLDGIGTIAVDRIELRERHPYAAHASEDEVMAVTLDAPAGVWLEARLDDRSVLVPIAERTQRFTSRIPEGGEWSIAVVSSLIEPADYRLSIDVFPPEASDRVATRDPDGFWSSTRMSPPALPDEDPVVYLTFDDGPHPTYTPQILDVLARHGAKATFFVVGYFAERYPLLVQRIAHEGHTLANHSWDHHSLARISRAAFNQSVERTQELLGPLATPCLRPPYWDLGRFTEEWSNELGLKLVGWTYSPRDWEQPPATAIADGLIARTSPGAVILLHDGGGPRSATVRGLDMALERLSDRGLEFKPICR